MAYTHEQIESMNEIDLAITAFYNIVRPKNPDKTLSDMEHWSVVLTPPAPPHRLFEALGVSPDAPNLVVARVGGRRERWVVAMPVAIANPEHGRVVEAVANIVLLSLWPGRFRRAAPRVAALLMYEALDAMGVVTEELRVAVAASTGNITVFSRSELEALRRRYRRYLEEFREVIEAAREVGEALSPVADMMDDVLLALALGLDEYLGERELLEIAAVDGRLALAASAARVFRDAVRRLLRTAIEAAKRIDEKLEALREEAARLYRETGDARRVAEELGVAVGTVYRKLGEAGVKPPRSTRKRRLTEEEKRKILEMFEKGHSIYSIAKTLGRPVSTVYQFLRRMGKV